MQLRKLAGRWAQVVGVGGAEVGCSGLGKPRSGRLQEGKPLGFLPCGDPKVSGMGLRALPGECGARVSPGRLRL